MAGSTRMLLSKPGRHLSNPCQVLTTSMSVHRLLLGAAPWWSRHRSVPRPWENTLWLEYTATRRSW
jgi:hypothetical protein